MVLWIGYLQWHFRTHGNVSPPEPVIRKFANIQNRDALLTWKRSHYATDKDGKIITRWNGETYKADPATGRQVPDESAVVVNQVYEEVTAAEWPKADFIVGNPPFIGGKDKRAALGYGYFDALTKTYADLPESCDFVMYWWHKAAELVRMGKARRFGFITTNSINQIFNRRIVAQHLDAKEKPLHLAFAVPDHPWVDASDGAAVRIAMTVGAKGAGQGVLATVIDESEAEGRERNITLYDSLGVIHADLRQGSDITRVLPLQANGDLCCPGMKLHGSGFIVTPEEAVSLGLGRIPGLEHYIRGYRNGKDITGIPRGVMLIDLFGLTAEQVREQYPDVYQWVATRVKPEREAKREGSKDSAQYADRWWLFGKPRETFRPALAGLPRYIATVETAKYRFFVFLSGDILPDNMLVNIASADAWHLGVLSSRFHVCWALTAGGTLENRPRYNKSQCFDPFPFPTATPEQEARIRDLGEKLDAHRKARQTLFPKLTMTGMYNALEALRAGRELTAKEKTVHEQGLVTVLRELHDELDAAVADAYGWPVDLPDEEILSRLVALNAERAKEEKQGKIRWLRPEYQTKSKTERKAVQAKLVPDAEMAPATPKGKASPAANAPKQAKASSVKAPWPAELLEQTQAVRAVVSTLQDKGIPVTKDSVAECFTRAPRARVEEILRVLEALGFV
jgi:hypothetical protein